MRLPLSVVPALFVLEEVVVFKFELPVVKLKGEQPTKFGAVEFTASHSWRLNWMAAGRRQL